MAPAPASTNQDDQRPPPAPRRNFRRKITMLILTIIGTLLHRKMLYDTDNIEIDYGDLRRLDPSISIHFYIKTSGIHRYLQRVKRTAHTWARDTDGNVTLITDGINERAVSAFGYDNPHLSIIRVRGEYRGVAQERPKTHAEKVRLWQEQRMKMRAVFENYSHLHPSPDWICYLNDSMMVNVKNLKSELKRLKPICSPNCLIADGLRFVGTTPYTSGGWCMERDLATRVDYLLVYNTDEDLKWLSEDDVPFNAMLKRQLNITRLNSPHWYSRLSKPNMTDNGVKKVSLFDHGYENIKAVTWEDNPVFMKAWLPTLSVFDIGYALPVGAAKKKVKIA